MTITQLQFFYYILFGTIGFITLAGIFVKWFKSLKKTKKYSKKQKIKYWSKILNDPKTIPSKKQYAQKRLKVLKK